MAERPPRVYCVDTSALIDLPIHYPRSVFGDTVWRSLEHLISARRLRVPREVRRELGKREGDEIYRWVKARPTMIVGPDAHEQRLLREIMERYPDWVDHETTLPVADPVLIALARSYNPTGIVVTHERPRGPGALKIPNVCQHYGIQWMTLPQMFVNEGWRFSPAP